MENAPCPHCDSGVLVGGNCFACGWPVPYPVTHPARGIASSVLPRSGHAPWILLTVAAAFVNLLFPSLIRGSDSAFLMAFFVAAVVCQLSLATTYSVFGPGKLHWRMCAVLLAGCGLIIVQLMGVALASSGVPFSGREAKYLASLMLMLPMFLLALQFPLWIMRAAMGCTLFDLRATEHESAHGRQQFRISQLLAVTTFVAVALSLARAGLSLFMPNEAQLARGWIGLGIYCGLALVSSSLLIVPCIFAVLRSKSPGLMSIAILGCGLFLAIVAVALTRAPGEVALVVGGFVLMCFGQLMASLAIVRGSGFAMPR